jgi:ankyrin repeat protein
LQPTGATAITIAAEHGHGDIAALLLQYQADPNWADKVG